MPWQFLSLPSMFSIIFFSTLCREGDSNPHGISHTPLKRTCLPIPPSRLLLTFSIFTPALYYTDFLCWLQLCSDFLLFPFFFLFLPFIPFLLNFSVLIRTSSPLANPCFAIPGLIQGLGSTIPALPNLQEYSHQVILYLLFYLGKVVHTFSPDF